MNPAHDDNATMVRRTRRYWRRTDQPAAGWWPWGWIPLLGLVLTFAYGIVITAPETQAHTRDGVARALADSGYTQYDVVADGQRVIVGGEGTMSENVRIASIARGAACNTFLARNLNCPTRVDVELRAPAKSAVETTQQKVVSDTPDFRPHAFSFRKQGTQLLLDGDVPDEVTRKRIVDAATGSFASVTDALNVTRSTAMPGYDWASGQALQILQIIDDGGVTWTDGTLSAWGRIQENDEPVVRAVFGSGQDGVRFGKLDLTVVSAVDQCNENFAAALSDTTIRFQTGSAAISADTAPLLQRLAALADECQVALEVEGHTDNVGNVRSNRRLSLARAEAVAAALQALGVDGSRLTPRGYGPERPVADNDSRDGRARNRRIEIRASAGAQPAKPSATNTE